jgi:hypothetical protein
MKALVNTVITVPSVCYKSAYLEKEETSRRDEGGSFVSFVTLFRFEYTKLKLSLRRFEWYLQIGERGGERELQGREGEQERHDREGKGRGRGRRA